jgi:peptide methionine sulfoxide reductase MsrA
MAENEMCFPETWEEFRKQYRIVDTKKVYTNGIEMIPTFRVEQWLDHMESVMRSQQSEQNKMAQVAQMFGKKLGEQFSIIRYGKRYDARFLG